MNTTEGTTASSEDRAIGAGHPSREQAAEPVRRPAPPRPAVLNHIEPVRPSRAAIKAVCKETPQ